MASGMMDMRLAMKILVEHARWLLEAGFSGERSVLETEQVLTESNVLDVGCGAGTFSGLFNADGYLGIDVDLTALTYARRLHGGMSFSLMRGNELALRSRSFDAALISGVIHHLHDDDALNLLYEVRRVLKQGARVVIWEDVHPPSKLNVVGAIVNRLDFGKNIREPAAYVELVARVFGAPRHYPMRSGVCNYIVLVATKPAGRTRALPGKVPTGGWPS